MGPSKELLNLIVMSSRRGKPDSHHHNKSISTEVITVPTEKPRYSITVDDELMRRIDDFRFTNRYPSRSAATVELIRLGIETLKKKQEEAAVSAEISEIRL